jgi:acetate kinase
MNNLILVLNAGSSSLKFSVFSLAPDLTVFLNGQIEGIGTEPRFIVKDNEGTIIAEEHWSPVEVSNQEDSLERLANWLRANRPGYPLTAVGHRVVHGGPDFTSPAVVNDEVMAKLESFVPLAPLHQPHNLAAIRAVTRFNPRLPQVACFDTSFHRTQPKVAELFGLPYEYYDNGIRRYGFHGLSYEYISKKLKTITPLIASARVVVAHLGSGASMCAMMDGRSVATTMGFTAIGGLPMGTRCGNLDPGVIIYLVRERGFSIDKVEDLLYKRSGLLGLSGVSNDMRRLLSSTDPRAAEAVDYFIYRVACELGSLVSALGGLDALVFTAGIGENSPEIRSRICARSAWLGIHIDEIANNSNALCISKPNSSVSVLVVPTNEEYVIARHTIETLGLDKMQ